MAHRRAGGYVDRGDGAGWVLDDPPPPPPPVSTAPAYVEGVPVMPVTGGWALVPPTEPVASPEPEPAPEPAPEPEPSDAEVRAWARDAGINVPAQGRLSKKILERYANREM